MPDGILEHVLEPPSISITALAAHRKLEASVEGLARFQAKKEAIPGESVRHVRVRATSRSRALSHGYEKEVHRAKPGPMQLSRPRRQLSDPPLLDMG